MRTRRDFVLLFAPLSLLILQFGGCSQISKEDKESKVQTLKVEKQKASLERNKKVSSFLSELISSSGSVIELSKIAQENSANRDVLKLSKGLIHYHKSFINSVNTLAAKKGIQLNQVVDLNSPLQLQKLKNRQNLKFDQEYCKIMVKKHEELLKKIESKPLFIDSQFNKTIEVSVPELRTYYDGTLYTQRRIKAIVAMQ